MDLERKIEDNGWNRLDSQEYIVWDDVLFKKHSVKQKITVFAILREKESYEELQLFDTKYKFLSCLF